MASSLWNLLRDIYSVAYAVVLFGIVLNIVRILPARWTQGLADALHKRCQHDPEAPMSARDFLDSTGTWGNMMYFVKTTLREIVHGYVSEGEKVPSVELVRLSGSGREKTNCRLLDFMQPGRPLVVNFGSCS